MTKNDISTPQEFLNISDTAKYMNTQKYNGIKAVSYNINGKNKLMIVDGNHRFVAAKLNGVKKVKIEFTNDNYEKECKQEKDELESKKSQLEQKIGELKKDTELKLKKRDTLDLEIKNLERKLNLSKPILNSIDLSDELIEFFQEVNGVQYPLRNGAFNVLNLIDII